MSVVFMSHSTKEMMSPSPSFLGIRSDLNPHSKATQVNCSEQKLGAERGLRDHLVERLQWTAEDLGENVLYSIEIDTF